MMFEHCIAKGIDCQLFIAVLAYTSLTIRHVWHLTLLNYDVEIWKLHLP